MNKCQSFFVILKEHPNQLKCPPVVAILKLLPNSEFCAWGNVCGSEEDKVLIHLHDYTILLKVCGGLTHESHPVGGGCEVENGY